MNIMSGRRNILLRLTVLVQSPIIQLHALMIHLVHLVLLILQAPMILQVLHQVHGQAEALMVAVLLAVGKNK